MEALSACPECGAAWKDGFTCEDAFGQMLVWEHEHANTHYSVHHLMVLCFYLQHPSRYSPDGLRYAKTLLVDFLERGKSPQEIRRQNRNEVDSGRRTFPITARAGSLGAYEHPVRWQVTAADVCAGGVDAYVENVRAWARAVYQSLRDSNNLNAGG